MTDNKHSFEESQLSEYSQLIYSQLLEGLATISNFEKDSSSKFPEIEGKIDQEVEDVFNLFLERILLQPNAYSTILCPLSLVNKNFMNQIGLL